MLIAIPFILGSAIGGYTIEITSRVQDSITITRKPSFTPALPRKTPYKGFARSVSGKCRAREAKQLRG